LNSIGSIITNVWLKIKKSNPYLIKKISKIETEQDTFKKNLDKRA
jgi:hypothetical protein